MNSCIIAGTIVQEPELRYTTDNQTPTAQTFIEFQQMVEGGNYAPAHLKVKTWGEKLSDELKSAQVGQQLVLEGSLRMETTESPDGRKQKYGELWVSKIHKA